MVSAEQAFGETGMAAAVEVGPPGIGETSLLMPVLKGCWLGHQRQPISIKLFSSGLLEKLSHCSYCSLPCYGVHLGAFFIIIIFIFRDGVLL